MSQLSNGHVFMSYSRRDDVVMRRVVAFLRKQGIKVWVDNEKLIPGTPVWEEEIEKAIKNAPAVVVVASPDSKKSEWVRREISLADQYKRRVFPVLVRGDEEDSITIRLVGRQYVDIRNDEDAGLSSMSASLLLYLEGLKIQEQLAEDERIEREKVETENRLREAKEEANRLSIQKAEEERLSREKAETERKAREEAERLVTKIAEEKRITAKKAEAERLVEQRTEKEHIAEANIETTYNTEEEALKNDTEKNISENVKKFAIENKVKRKTTKLSSSVFWVGGAVIIFIVLCGVASPRLFSGIFNQPFSTLIPTSEITAIGSSLTTVPATASQEPTLAATQTDIITTATPNEKIIISPENASKISVITSITFPNNHYLADISNDFTIAATRSDDGYEVKVWNLTDGNLIATISEKSEVDGIALSPNKDIIAIAPNDKTIQLWDIYNNQLINTLVGHVNYVKSLAFSPSGELLVSGSRDTTVKLWDVTSGKLLHTFTGHTGSISQIKFSSNGEFAFTSSNDQTIRMLDINNLSNYKTFDFGTKDIQSIPSIMLSSNGNYLASEEFETGLGKFALKVWDIGDETVIGNYEGFDFAYSPSGETFAYRAIDESKNVNVGDKILLGSEDNYRIVNIKDGSHLMLVLPTNCNGTIQYSPDSQIIADSCGNLWSTSNGSLLGQIQIGGHIGSFNADWTRLLIYAGYGSYRYSVWGIKP